VKTSVYPFITKYGAEKIKFTYLSCLGTEYQYRLLYWATLDDVPNSPIVVKFIERYNVGAYRLLAAQSLAPKLYYSSTDNNMHYGKWFMIVMDYVDLKHLSGCLTNQQHKHLKDAITILHSKNMVFSDLR